MKTFLIIICVIIVIILLIAFWCSLVLGKEADEHAEKLYYEHLKKLNEEGK